MTFFLFLRLKHAKFREFTSGKQGSIMFFFLERVLRHWHTEVEGSPSLEVLKNHGDVVLRNRV